MTHPETPTDNSRIYTPAEIAELLSCSRTHVYRLVSSGALGAVDIAVPGSRKPKTRVRQRDLEAYLNAHKMLAIVK